MQQLYTMDLWALIDITGCSNLLYTYINVSRRRIEHEANYNKKYLGGV